MPVWHLTGDSSLGAWFRGINIDRPRGGVHLFLFDEFERIALLRSIVVSVRLVP